MPDIMRELRLFILMMRVKNLLSTPGIRTIVVIFNLTLTVIS